MGKINKAAAAGVIFFSIILAGFVGIKIDQPTVAILGGAFVGLVVAIPTTALVISIWTKQRDTPHDQASALNAPPPVFPQQQAAQQVTHNHHHVHKYVVHIYVSANADNVLKRWTVARDLNTTLEGAQDLIDKGAVKFLQEKS